MNKELEEAIERIKYLLTDGCDCEACKKDKKAYKTVSKELERLQEENSKLERANKTYINSIQSITPVLLEYYIPKDIIREKIKEMQNQYEEALEENSTKSFILKCQIEGFKEFEKELLHNK